MENPFSCQNVPNNTILTAIQGTVLIDEIEDKWYFSDIGSSNAKHMACGKKDGANTMTMYNNSMPVHCLGEKCLPFGLKCLLPVRQKKK